MTTSELRVAITGASGYVGSRIADYLRKNAFQVIELNRQARDGGIGYVLGETVPRHRLSDTEVLVHCAYDFTAYGWNEIKRVNVDGTLKLFEAAQSAGVKRIIFISTLSAFQGCASLYGRAKLLVEEEGKAMGIVTIRPGLVYDDHHPGGMIGALNKLVGLTPVIPLVSSGRQILYPCHSEDLSHLVYKLCLEAPAVDVPISAACRRGWYFRDILRAIAVSKKRHPVLLPTPEVLLTGGLKLAGFVGVRTRFRDDSLVSLLNQNPQVDFTQLDKLGMEFRDFQF